MKQHCSATILGMALLAACSADGPDPKNSAKSQAESPAAYRVVDRLDAPDGGYDYISVDEAARKLFVGRDSGVMTVDLASGRTSTLLERKEVAAVLIIPDTNLMLSTNYGSNTATLFNRETGEVLADIPTGRSPDGALFDSVSGHIFVMNADSEDVTVIDLSAAKRIATVPVGGKPEAAATDLNGHVYVNVEDTNEIAVIDVASRKVDDRYALAQCHEPTGIAYDPATDLLISVCHNNIAKLIEARTGNDRGNIAIGSGADGSIFDVATRTGFVSCIDGTLTIYGLDELGKATVLQTIKTADGARTEAYDSWADRLYLPAAAVERDEAGEYLGAEKNFQIVVVGTS